MPITLLHKKISASSSQVLKADTYSLYLKQTQNKIIYDIVLLTIHVNRKTIIKKSRCLIEAAFFIIRMIYKH